MRYMLSLFFSLIIATSYALPKDFSDEVVFKNLNQPTSIRFAPNGEIFVTEKSGIIKHYDNLNSTNPTVFADLRTKVYNFWDRGLLGLAIDPNWPSTPHIYVLYAYDGDIGGNAPKYGAVNGTDDPCPEGATSKGCKVSGRLSRLVYNGSQVTETVLINDWCQIFPSHSIGDLFFGSDGALYASAGEGANFFQPDYGQLGTPVNFCNDPIDEGGAFRSQDLASGNDSVTLDGSVIRIDPKSDLNGEISAKPWPNNPLINNPDINAQRIIGHGFRNPFRMAARPGTNEVWVGDVGWDTYEEVNLIENPSASTVSNFGWPCLEGNGAQPFYSSKALCQTLITAQTTTSPYFSYKHSDPIAPGETCTTGTSSITGLSFYTGNIFPPQYSGALFGVDYSRNCLWVMLPDESGKPSPSNVSILSGSIKTPIDLQNGPDGQLYYVDFNDGEIHRIAYYNSNKPPIANIVALENAGTSPVEFTLDGSSSSDPDGQELVYQWDLNEDGDFNDANGAIITQSFEAGTHVIGLKVTDPFGLSDTEFVPLGTDNTPPEVTIDTPVETKNWRIGETISFSGHATDLQDGNLPASAMSWKLRLHHCSEINHCHTHDITNFENKASGSFVVPDHQYPTFLELIFTAKDSKGLQTTTSTILAPLTVPLNFDTVPSGLELRINDNLYTTPATITSIVGSTVAVEAPNQNKDGTNYYWSSWTNNKERIHSYPAPQNPSNLIANYSNNSNPVASFEVSSRFGWKPFSVFADGSASFDEDGDPLKYQWQFDTKKYSGSNQVTHSFTATGKKMIKLTVSDPSGKSHQIEKLVYILSKKPSNPLTNQAPISWITAKTPISGTLPFTVDLTAEQAFDPEGEPLTYEWKYDGKTYYGPIMNYTFNKSGTFTVSLTVKDPQGKSNSESISVKVSKPKSSSSKRGK